MYLCDVFSIHESCPRLSSAEKYAEIQQNPLLPPAPLFLRSEDAEEVSAPLLLITGSLITNHDHRSHVGHFTYLLKVLD